MYKGKIYRSGRIQAGDVYIDGNRIGDVGNAVIKDRKIMGNDGIVVVIANIDSNHHQLLGKVNITTRGFVLVNENMELVKKLEEIAHRAILSKCKNHVNYSEIKGEIISRLSEYAYEMTGRKPIILPVIMDIKRNNKEPMKQS